jgi:hypothetical protein
MTKQDADFRSGRREGNVVRGSLSELLNKKLDEIVKIDGRPSSARAAICDAVVSLAMRKDKWAIEFIWDRIEGRPATNMNLGGTVPQSLAALISSGLQQPTST